MATTLSSDRIQPPESWDELSDAEAFELRARRVSVPRAGATDSFRLHAPLELLARQALLQHVDPALRPAVRDRMGTTADTFELSGEPMRSPVAVAHQPADQHQRLDLDLDLHLHLHLGLGLGLGLRLRLGRAIAAGDVEGADLWMAAVAPALSVDDLVGAMADEVLLRLAGAAHGSILLHLLLRVAPRSAAATQLGRGLVAELAADPDPRIEWIDRRPEVSPRRPTSGDRLWAALACPESLGEPGSIAPTMSLVDRSGLAAEVLSDSTSGLSVRDARRTLLRTAAHSMLQDDPSRAPYGWTHCLTMPQATLGIARFCTRPDHAVAVASTYVLGFRSTLSNTPIDPKWQPARPRRGRVVDPAELLERGPQAAAAAMWHAESEQRPALIRHLAGVAASHHDAHLAKYTLACLDAARDDPDGARLYLAAAAHLAAWWADRDAAS